jgi:hypothetical protein
MPGVAKLSFLGSHWNNSPTNPLTLNSSAIRFILNHYIFFYHFKTPAFKCPNSSHKLKSDCYVDYQFIVFQ